MAIIFVRATIQTIMKYVTAKGSLPLQKRVSSLVRQMVLCVVCGHQFITHRSVNKYKPVMNMAIISAWNHNPDYDEVCDRQREIP